jgi:glycosyltransferase involved in cell wall biosynthesis
MTPAVGSSPGQLGAGASDPRIAVVIPALDEEASIGRVLAELPRGLAQVLVVDNGSRDRTAQVARAAGATVVAAERRGYGAACLAGMAALDSGEIVVFLDADHSDHADELPRLTAPLLSGEADLVIGSRALGEAEPGSMLPQQRFGNWLATRMIRVLFGYRYSDLGPFRAIHRQAYEQLGMRDQTYGWTVEMQVRALQVGLRVVEVPVSYRRRIGRSKIAGTLRGTVGAGVKIVGTILRLWVTRGAAAPQLPLSDQS